MQHHKQSRSQLLADRQRLASVLAELYRQQAAADPANAYLSEHGSPKWIAGQVLTYQHYRQHLPRGGKVLDWGCRHAPDSCLLRHEFGDALELLGCDLEDADKFAAFHQFAGLNYAKLDHEYQLPYDSDFFDVVIGSGVLEHVVLEYESLKEVRRVLKPGGILVITYLPNRWSVAEWKRRVSGKQEYHQRRYSHFRATELFKGCGLLPIVSGYQSRLWRLQFDLLSVGTMSPAMARTLDKLLLTQWLGPTLWFVCRKVRVV